MILAAVVSVVILAGGGTIGVAVKKNTLPDLEMWIDERQVNMYGGLSAPFYAISDGVVENHIKDPYFEQLLPIIPSQISCVNFSWNAGVKNNYTYNFHTLQSFNTNILHDPSLSIDREGVIPHENGGFSIFLSCVGNSSGIAHLRVRLQITNSDGVSVPGMPLKLDLRKECREIRLVTGPDNECDKKCNNNGTCDENKVCKCPYEYMGQYCEIPICYPACMNNGNCTAKGVCNCPPGFIGSACEGGMCTRKCENKGKCVQKDKCECTPGFFGTYCELTKCPVQCINDGLCIGDDLCQCKKYFTGRHCEKPRCKPECVHGVCVKYNRCKCDPGWTGRKCRKEVKNHQTERARKKNDI